MEETKLLSGSEDDIKIVARLLKSGEIVGVPTETVYGLAADAMNPDAVKKIFKAKGRPSDNPLIVHISDMDMLNNIACNIPDLAYKLADKFWSGPLTMVLKKRSEIPYVTTGGLDTVAVRMPSHKIMKEIIKIAGLPLAAPSANLSGYPSPTKAQHVMKDMNGKIAAVVDGGECDYGLESTVIAFENENSIRILRPGNITREDLLDICDDVIIDNSVLSDVCNNEQVSSPGMKYKHYSPKARIIIVEGEYEYFEKYISKNIDEDTYALIFDNETEKFPYKHLTYGDNSIQQAHQLFAKLRELDEIGAKTVYVRGPKKNGIGLAVYNRLIRAAGFEVIKI